MAHGPSRPSDIVDIPPEQLPLVSGDSTIAGLPPDPSMVSQTPSRDTLDPAIEAEPQSLQGKPIRT